MKRLVLAIILLVSINASVAFLAQFLRPDGTSMDAVKRMFNAIDEKDSADWERAFCQPSLGRLTHPAPGIRVSDARYTEILARAEYAEVLAQGFMVESNGTRADLNWLVRVAKVDGKWCVVSFAANSFLSEG